MQGLGFIVSRVHGFLWCFNKGYSGFIRNFGFRVDRGGGLQGPTRAQGSGL